MANKMVIHWWEDSSGRHTCHRNEKGLTFDQSFVGEIKKEKDGWYCVTVMKRTGPHTDMYAARRELQELLGAVVLDYNS